MERTKRRGRLRDEQKGSSAGQYQKKPPTEKGRIRLGVIKKKRLSTERVSVKGKESIWGQSRPRMSVQEKDQTLLALEKVRFPKGFSSSKLRAEREAWKPGLSAGLRYKGGNRAH